MPKYKFCNFAIESDFPFAELEALESPEPECRITLTRGMLRDDSDCEWLQTWSLPDETPWLLFGRQAHGYFLRFPTMADFSVSNNAREICCYATPDTPAETIRHLILDQVLPLLLSRHGRIVLHGSAAATPRGAIAFVGETGWGKSTLVSSFAEAGMAVLTDDCLLLHENASRLLVIPSYPGVRLWPETALTVFGTDKPWTQVAHYTQKKRLGAEAGIRFCTWPTELRRLYFLAPPDESARLRVERLSPRDTMLELVKYCYLMDVTDRARLHREFERLAEFALMPLFRRLTFPHDFSQLPTTREAILSDAAIAD
jgi:hypothetical protein